MVPDNWKNLQFEVANILRECGFSVITDKKMMNVRGEVSIDVYAEELVKGRKYSIIVECKYWNRKIPQSVIHSFRTVVADIGTNIGYVISLKGFQSGAFKASGFSNIQLLTWEEFQDKFEESWLENYFSPIIKEKLDPLFTYCEPQWTSSFQNLSLSEITQVTHLRDKYGKFSFLLLLFSRYNDFDEMKKIIPKLPVENSYYNDPDLHNIIPHHLLYEKAFREFLMASIKYGEEGIAEFKKVLKQKDK